MHYPQADLCMEQSIFLQVIPVSITVSCYKESVMPSIEKLILLGHKSFQEDQLTRLSQSQIITIHPDSTSNSIHQQWRRNFTQMNPFNFRFFPQATLGVEHNSNSTVTDCFFELLDAKIHSIVNTSADYKTMLNRPARNIRFYSLRKTCS